MKRALMLATAALALLVPASLAYAALPKPADPTVVVPTSLAGIGLGMPEGKAKAAWGGGRGKCESAGTTNVRCSYGLPSGSQGYGLIEFRDHKVGAVTINSGRDAAGGLLTTAAKPIMEMKTKGGVGIGSKYSKVKGAYPKGKLVGTTTEPYFYWSLSGKGGGSFSFVFDGESKRVVELSLNDGKPA